MKNNIENAIKQLEDFIRSDTEKVVLIKGTHQYKKHELVFSFMQEFDRFKTGLFRVNSLQNTSMFLEQAGYNIKHNKSFKSGESYRFKGFNLYIDSLFTERTWGNTPSTLDFAIIYPLDSFCEQKDQKKQKLIDNLTKWKHINKIFIVTWTDIRHDYEWLNRIVDRTIIYDVEEEDPAYHKRVLDLEKEPF